MRIRRLIYRVVRKCFGPGVDRALAEYQAKQSERQLRDSVRQPDRNQRTVPSIFMNGDFQTSPLAQALFTAFQRANTRAVSLPATVRDVEGMSGQRYRDLINVLIGSVANARYLEVGSWAGSTATAALFGNTVNAVCIDNWSQFGGPRDAFVANTGRVLSSSQKLRLIE